MTHLVPATPQAHQPPLLASPLLMIYLRGFTPTHISLLACHLSLLRTLGLPHGGIHPTRSPSSSQSPSSSLGRHSHLCLAPAGPLIRMGTPAVHPRHPARRCCPALSNALHATCPTLLNAQHNRIARRATLLSCPAQTFSYHGTAQLQCTLPLQLPCRAPPVAICVSPSLFSPSLTHSRSLPNSLTNRCKWLRYVAQAHNIQGKRL